MRRIVLFLALTLACSSFASAQAVTRWHIAGGLAFPNGPDQFYDYWKQGYHVMVAAELGSFSDFIQVVGVEFNYFPFDADRFLKQAGVSTSFSSVTGSSAMIISASYVIRYGFSDFPSFQPSFFAGFGGAGSLRSSATVQYPLYKVSQEGTKSVVPIIPVGIAVKLYEGESSTVDVSFAYTFGLTKSQTINSNFSSLKLDVAFD